MSSRQAYEQNMQELQKLQYLHRQQLLSQLQGDRRLPRMKDANKEIIINPQNNQDQGKETLKANPARTPSSAAAEHSQVANAKY